MIKHLTKLIFLGIAGVVIYYLLNYHFVFFDKKPRMLKKSRITLEETFVNGNVDAYRTAEDLLRIERLREDGIGNLLVEAGKLSLEELARIEQRIDSGAPTPKSDLFNK